MREDLFLEFEIKENKPSLNCSISITVRLYKSGNFDWSSSPNRWQIADRAHSPPCLELSILVDESKLWKENKYMKYFFFK